MFSPSYSSVSKFCQVEGTRLWWDARENDWRVIQRVIFEVERKKFWAFSQYLEHIDNVIHVPNVKEFQSGTKPCYERKYAFCIRYSCVQDRARKSTWNWWILHWMNEWGEDLIANLYHISFALNLYVWRKIDDSIEEYATVTRANKWFHSW